MKDPGIRDPTNSQLTQQPKIKAMGSGEVMGKKMDVTISRICCFSKWKT